METCVWDTDSEDDHVERRQEPFRKPMPQSRGLAPRVILGKRPPPPNTGQQASSAPTRAEATPGRASSVSSAAGSSPNPSKDIAEDVSTATSGQSDSAANRSATRSVSPPAVDAPERRIPSIPNHIFDGVLAALDDYVVVFGYPQAEAPPRPARTHPATLQLTTAASEVAPLGARCAACDAPLVCIAAVELSPCQHGICVGCFELLRKGAGKRTPKTRGERLAIRCPRCDEGVQKLYVGPARATTVWRAAGALPAQCTVCDWSGAAEDHVQHACTLWKTDRMQAMQRFLGQLGSTKYHPPEGKGMPADLTAQERTVELLVFRESEKVIQTVTALHRNDEEVASLPFYLQEYYQTCVLKAYAAASRIVGRSGDSKRAMEYAKAGLRIDHFHIGCLISKGIVLRDAANTPAALAAFQKALRQDEAESKEVQELKKFIQTITEDSSTSETKPTKNRERPTAPKRQPEVHATTTATAAAPCSSPTPATSTSSLAIIQRLAAKRKALLKQVVLSDESTATIHATTEALSEIATLRQSNRRSGSEQAAEAVDNDSNEQLTRQVQRLLRWSAGAEAGVGEVQACTVVCASALARESAPLPPPPYTPATDWVAAAAADTHAELAEGKSESAWVGVVVEWLTNAAGSDFPGTGQASIPLVQETEQKKPEDEDDEQESEQEEEEEEEEMNTREKEMEEEEEEEEEEESAGREEEEGEDADPETKQPCIEEPQKDAARPQRPVSSLQSPQRSGPQHRADTTGFAPDTWERILKQDAFIKNLDPIEVWCILYFARTGGTGIQATQHLRAQGITAPPIPRKTASRYTLPFDPKAVGPMAAHYRRYRPQKVRNVHPTLAPYWDKGTRLATTLLVGTSTIHILTDLQGRPLRLTVGTDLDDVWCQVQRLPFLYPEKRPPGIFATEENQGLNDVITPCDHEGKAAAVVQQILQPVHDLRTFLQQSVGLADCPPNRLSGVVVFLGYLWATGNVGFAA